MPRHLISDAHEWINEIPTVPIYYLAKPQPRERAWQNQRGKKTQQHNPSPPQAARGRQGGGHVPKVGVRDRATGKALEGADRQTDKQTVHAL